MSRLTNLVTIWVIAWLGLLVMMVGSVKPSKININCLQFIPHHFWNRTVYSPASQELQLEYNLSSLAHLAKCLNQTAAGTEYRVQLISVLESDGERERCCDLQCQSATRYYDQALEHLQSLTLRYVLGPVFLRLVRVVEEGGGTCEEGTFSSCSSLCSPVLQFGDNDTDQCRDALVSSSSNNVSSTNYDLVINQSFRELDQTCQFELELSFPVCYSIQSYSSAMVSLLEISLNQTCSDLDLMWDWQNSEVSTLTPLSALDHYYSSRINFSSLSG